MVNVSCFNVFHCFKCNSNASCFLTLRNNQWLTVLSTLSFRGYFCFSFLELMNPDIRSKNGSPFFPWYCSIKWVDVGGQTIRASWSLTDATLALMNMASSFPEEMGQKEKNLFMCYLKHIQGFVCDYNTRSGWMPRVQPYTKGRIRFTWLCSDVKLHRFHGQI